MTEFNRLALAEVCSLPTVLRMLAEAGWPNRLAVLV